MNKYDLHLHSVYSDGTRNPSQILKIAKKRGLNGLAITDHDTIKGGLMTKKENKDKDFEVIVGAEIRTNHGEILGYYLNEEIKPGDILEVLDKIKEQDGLASVSHPFAMLRDKLSYPVDKLKGKIHALECFNGRATTPLMNIKASKLAERYHLAKTGGSDAHTGIEIGRAYTLFEGDLRKAILSGKTTVGGSIFYSNIIKTLRIPHKIRRMILENLKENKK